MSDIMEAVKKGQPAEGSITFKGGSIFSGLEYNQNGVFGLISYRGDLYGTGATAPAKIMRVRGSMIETLHDFSDIGPAPRAGGDTYNAVTIHNDMLYMGGWIIAPAETSIPRNRILENWCRNKYTYLYEYDGSELKLVYKDSAHSATRWVGEISDLVSDGERLWVLREDGQVNLGHFYYDGRKIVKFNDTPASKGAVFNDFLVTWSPPKSLCFTDLDTMSFYTLPAEKVASPLSDIRVNFEPAGCVATTHERLFLGGRNGIFIGRPNPFEEEVNSAFVPLFIGGFDQVSWTASARCNTLAFNGGLLVSFLLPLAIMNEETRGQLLKQQQLESEADVQTGKKRTALSLGPTPLKSLSSSFLLYFKGSSPRIIMQARRFTSLAVHANKIRIATSTWGPIDSANYRTDGDVTVLGISPEAVEYASPPLDFYIWKGNYNRETSGLKGWFGGIPVTGYRDVRLIATPNTEGKLTIAEYDLENEAEEVDEISLKAGKRNLINLSQYGVSRIMAFKYDAKTRIQAFISLGG